MSAWGAGSYRVFAGLAREEGSGVRMLPGTEVLHARTGPLVGRRGARPGARPPAAGYADAWSFTAPVVDMPVYLRWLRARLEELGGTLTRISLGAACPSPTTSSSTARGWAPACSPATPTTRPVRGQVVVVEGVELNRWWLDSPDRRTSSRGRDTSWSAGPTSTGTGAGRRRRDGHRDPPAGHPLVPELAGARVVGHRVGLRPVRPAVRLEAEGRRVHCYGQGGAGVTLSWGCADEVVALVAELATGG